MNALSLLNKEITKPLITLLIPGLMIVVPIVLILYENPSFYILWNRDITLSLIAMTLISLGMGLVLEDVSSRIENSLRRLFFKKRNNFSNKNLKLVLNLDDNLYAQFKKSHYINKIKFLNKRLKVIRKEQFQIKIDLCEINKEIEKDKNRPLRFLRSLFKHPSNLENYIKGKFEDEKLKNNEQNFYRILLSYLSKELDSEKVLAVNYIDSLVTRMKFETGMISAIPVSSCLWAYLSINSFCLGHNGLLIILLIFSLTFCYLLYEAYESIASLHVYRRSIVEGEENNIHVNFFLEIINIGFKSPSQIIFSLWILSGILPSILLIFLHIIPSIDVYENLGVNDFCLRKPDIVHETIVDEGIVFNGNSGKYTNIFLDVGQNENYFPLKIRNDNNFSTLFNGFKEAGRKNIEVYGTRYDLQLNQKELMTGESIKDIQISELFNFSPNSIYILEITNNDTIEYKINYSDNKNNTKEVEFPELDRLTSDEETFKNWQTVLENSSSSDQQINEVMAKIFFTLGDEIRRMTQPKLMESLESIEVIVSEKKEEET